MSRFHVAFTIPVNDQQESTRLSVEDLWEGCRLLAFSPESFTSAISSCTVQSEAGGRMIRTLKFQADTPEMEQEVILTNMHKFECTTLATGNRVTTTIVRGVTDELDEFYLLFEYSIPYGDVSQDGPDGERFRTMYAEKAKRNLVDGVETMRSLKAEGRLRCNKTEEIHQSQ
ncbi:hypothetical protein LOZ66_005913 [Ophidiomyces ophidiicola]|nr:hypothetical protein LOZ65_000110 [Ophidiomyces ophidiicola]KAI1934445.1 hypothetical protein LOZ66_005913 [Ophidiomyces ophidiicola]